MARAGSSKPDHRTTKSAKPSTSTSTRASKRDEPIESVSSIPPELQQRCLNIFRDAFKPSSEDNVILQKIKGHLYNRDFAAAFGNEEYLLVYASKWSPSRALAYLQVFKNVGDYFSLDGKSDPDDYVLRAVCLGGGAGGELVGLSGWLHLLQVKTPASPYRLEVCLVDIADWTKVTNTLKDGITKVPELSKYASQPKKNANTPLLRPFDIALNFHQQDVLDTSDLSQHSPAQFFEQANLVTFMFTLNELYSTSLPKTQHLISLITASMLPGSLLLVVDSPGSYSTVSINGTEKKYPMDWLLDYKLLGPSKQDDKDTTTTQWEKLESDNSRWFRLPKSLQYPIELEDMRYQIHLYRRLGKEGD